MSTILINKKNEILKHILEIRDENDNIIKYDYLKTDFLKSKYSSTKNSIWHIFMVFNNENNSQNIIRITKKMKYRYKFKCLNCSNIQLIGSTQVLRKINKNVKYCSACVNIQDEKIENQIKSINKHYYNKNNGIERKQIKQFSKMSNIEKINYSKEQFDDMDDDYKDMYFMSHLSSEDYIRLRDKIISFKNGNIINNKNIIYIPYFICNNQMMFSSIMYDKVNDILFKANQPMIKCDTCNTIYRGKSIEGLKNKYKIYCIDCNFTNNIFKIRPSKNCLNERVCYQSKLELKFINFCNNNHIVVRNGPKVKYMFNGSQKTYKVDFEILLNDNKYMVEMKDNHIWHKNQVKSGKWAAKETAARNIIDNKNYYDYYFITPQNWTKYVNLIKKARDIPHIN